MYSSGQKVIVSRLKLPSDQTWPGLLQLLYYISPSETDQVKISTNCNRLHCQLPCNSVKLLPGCHFSMKQQFYLGRNLKIVVMSLSSLYP